MLVSNLGLSLHRLFFTVFALSGLALTAQAGPSSVEKENNRAVSKNVSQFEGQKIDIFCPVVGVDDVSIVCQETSASPDEHSIFAVYIDNIINDPILAEIGPRCGKNYVNKDHAPDCALAITVLAKRLAPEQNPVLYAVAIKKAF